MPSKSVVLVSSSISSFIRTWRLLHVIDLQKVNKHGGGKRVGKEGSTHREQIGSGAAVNTNLESLKEVSMVLV
jgi:hypothetical protein